MKRIGLLGGMSWESSIEYYRLVNEITRERLGGLHSSDCLLRSVDFAEIEQLQREGRWEDAGERLADEARALVAGGAELLVLCTNTMHKVAEAIAGAVDVPFVHIADTTAGAVRAAGLTTVGLLATGYTMEQDFYVGRLRDAHGLEVLVPGEDDRRIVHDVIYDELCVGIVDDGSREQYRRIMRGLADRGAQGILLGCTEIDLLVGPQDSPVPTFDTTRLHAARAVELALRPDGETISDGPTRNVIILTEGEEITITWSRFSPGERGPDLHVHRGHTDAFYMLEGELTFELGPQAERVRVGPGGFVAVPPNVAHSFVNESSGDARWLNFHAPDKGFADFLRTLRAGTPGRWDSFDVPADGGLPASEAVVSRSDMAVPGFELVEEPGDTFTFTHPGGVLGVRRSAD